MSRRSHLRRRIEMLDELGEIMGAMKNISRMETHKLARFLAHQHRVLASIETAAADFLQHHPQFERPGRPQAAAVIVAIGSQRGFCGDFNESVARAVDRVRGDGGRATQVLLVGRRLAAKVAGAIAILDAPGVVEEVQPALQRVMNALGELQSQTGRSEPLDFVLLAHREGEAGVPVRRILPQPPASPGTRFAYGPLLNLAAPEFFAGLVEHYLWAQMHDAFYGSLMAENRRRLQHLEGAMKRMQERSDRLRRRYNTLRQEEITEEIEVILLGDGAMHERAGRAQGAAAQ